MKKIVLIVGPTGVGKTSLSIKLAKLYNTELISGDSVQVYRSLDIGSGKIKESEKEGIKHHLIDILDPTQDYSVSDFQKASREIIDKILFEGKNFDLERFNDSISASLACHASVKANTPLSIEEMENIIEKLSKCKNPYNCAHGRPSIINYSTYELEKLFKRVM